MESVLLANVPFETWGAPRFPAGSRLPLVALDDLLQGGVNCLEVLRGSCVWVGLVECVRDTCRHLAEYAVFVLLVPSR